MKSGELSFSFEAFQGAMLVSLYRNEPRFHLPYLLLTLLVDVDELISKWRCTSVHSHSYCILPFVSRSHSLNLCWPFWFYCTYFFYHFLTQHIRTCLRTSIFTPPSRTSSIQLVHDIMYSI